MVEVGHIIFQGWAAILRTAIRTTLTYVALVIMLRVAGTGRWQSRTLST